MADSIIGVLQATSPDKKLDTTSLTVGANTVERERVQVSGAGAAELADVKNAAPVSTAYGLVVRPYIADIVGGAGTLGSLNATATVVAEGMHGVGMQLAAGTLIGTLTPEASFDGGTTWTATTFDDPVAHAKASTIVFGSANTATGQTISSVSGASQYRVRVSAYTSGTAACTLRGSIIAGDSGVFVQATASLFPPTYTAGTINPLNTDKGGSLRVGNNSVVDAGAVLGTPWILQPEISEDFRTRVEIDNVIDHEVMNQTAQNTAKHRIDNTTMAFTHSSGFNTNTGSITTINTGVAFSTYQYFSMFDGQVQYAYAKVKFTGTMLATNTTIDWGFFVRPTSTPYAPTDGAFFRTDNTGVYGCIVNNGTLTAASVIKTSFTGSNWTPTIGTEYDMIVAVWTQVVVFWLDFKDGNGYTMVGRINNPTAQASTTFAGSFPFSVRHAIGGTLASAVQGFTLCAYTVEQGGGPNNRPWSEQATAMGLSGAQGLSGQTQGSSALYTNSLAAGAGAAMTNTTAALGSGLGGQFSAQPTLAAGTDGILCSFQNPAPTANLTGRTLIIDSIKISGMVTTLFAGGPVLYAYSAAWGHTAVSLATAEAQNTKAPRRKSLGKHNFPVTAAVGAMPTGSAGDQVFITDIAVHPGEFFAITAKNLGTVTTAGVICFDVMVNSHYI